MNVSGILSHKIPNYIITNAIYFDWQFTIFGLEMFLTNILMISLFRSTNRMEFFSIRKKKSYIMEPYIYLYLHLFNVLGRCRRNISIFSRFEGRNLLMDDQNFKRGGDVKKREDQISK